MNPRVTRLAFEMLTVEWYDDLHRPPSTMVKKLDPIPLSKSGTPCFTEVAPDSCDGLS